MTLEQLEQRVNELEHQISELRRAFHLRSPMARVSDMFGMFADDSDFDEIVRLGREYREQANSEDRLRRTFQQRHAP